MVNNNALTAQKILLDVSKYGFEIIRISDSGTLFYKRTFNEHEIHLMISENIYSVSIKRKEHETIVANRYKIENQQQLDFLIYNGRVGSFFN